MQTAADSAVFKVATKKGLIRLAGLGSPIDDTKQTAGVDEYSARIAKATAVSSLWLGGLDDPISSNGLIACQFKFHNNVAGFINTLYMVPGFGHLDFSQMSTQVLSPVLKDYLTKRGFAGFVV